MGRKWLLNIPIAVFVMLSFNGLRAQESDHHKGAVKGIVLDTQGHPVGDVELKLHLDSGLEVKLKTHKDGTFMADDLLPGDYTVQVTKEGYRSFSTTFSIAPGKLSTYKLTIWTVDEAKEVRGGENWKKAMAAYKSGHLDEAETLLEKIIEVDPEYADAYFNIGIIQARRSACKKALENLDKAIQYHFAPSGKTQMTYYYAVASCNEKLNNLDKAVEPYRQLAHVAPQQFAVPLGNILVKLKRFDEAKAAYEDYLKAVPKGQTADQVRKVLKELKQ